MHDASKAVKGLVGSSPTAPRRIVVIGRAGAGKTTAALALGQAFGLPVVHLDRFAWSPGWTPVDAATFEEAQAAAVAGERWVIDGGYLRSAGWPARVARADVVVLVEAPLIVCLWRIARRVRARPRVRRPDLPDGCDEVLTPSFVGWTLLWSLRTRRQRHALGRGSGEGPVPVRIMRGEDAVALVGAATEGPPDAHLP